MTRPSLVALLALWPPLFGCAGFSSRPPPGPRPIAEPWRPVEVLRENLLRTSSGEVVLNEQDGLSPDEAAILAIDHNPRLRAIRVERNIGQAELLTAGVLPNPRLEGSIGFPRSNEEAGVLGYGVALSWNVVPLLSRSAQVSAAKEALASIDLEVAWQEWQVAQAARLHALRSIFLERRVRLAQELEETWQQRLRSFRQARAANAVTELDVTNAERSLAEARLNRLELEQRLVAERSDLNRALGIDAAEDIILDASFNSGTSTPLGERLLDGLPRRRLDLIALQHAQRSRDQALRAAVIARFPPVEVGFQVAREVDRVSTAGFAVSFGIPFFDRNQASVARESARRVQVEAEYDARLLDARIEVRRAIKALGLMVDQLGAAREASEAAGRLAEQARAAAVSGALNPLLAADILERSYAAQLRTLELDQMQAELRIALALASGADAP